MLRCKALSKSVDGVQALSGGDLQFRSSGIVAIIGPNGAGKTTLLHALTGFLEPNAGRCFIGDQEITHLSPHHIACLGVARSLLINDAVH